MLYGKKNIQHQNDATHFSDNHDHILVYAKQKERTKFNGLSRTDSANKRYINYDNDLRGKWKTSDTSVKGINKKNIYEIITPSGRKVNPPSRKKLAWFQKKKWMS